MKNRLSDDELTNPNFDEPDANNPAWKQTHNSVQRIAEKLLAKAEGYAPDLRIRGIDIDEDNATKDLVASIRRDTKSFELWAKKIDVSVSKESEDRYSRVVPIFLRRMERLGYQECDIQTFITMGDFDRHLPRRFKEFGFSFKDPLRFFRRSEPTSHHDPATRVLRSYAEWHVCKPYFCKGVEEQQALRLQYERNLLVETRKYIVREVYQRRFATLTADIQNIFPTPSGIELYNHFHALIQSSSEEALKESEITKAVDQFFDHWPPKTLDDLCSFYPSVEQPPASHRHIDPPHNLEAASFVFLCRQCFESDGSSGSVIGWQATIPHLRCVEFGPTGPLELSERGCAAAVTLLDHLGLDPRSTLPAELDGQGFTFACVPCSSKHGRSIILSWREAINHFIFERHGAPEWKKLSSEDILSMQVLQKHDEDEEVDTWSSVADLF
ncbi:hypothetical protein H0H87_007248 [Tephrocybe sp. NHM501043]|nr:hypothetical protein H0H87_007248 [Tephrocybe sp. NHM501043]